MWSDCFIGFMYFVSRRLGFVYLADGVKPCISLHGITKGFEQALLNPNTTLISVSKAVISFRTPSVAVGCVRNLTAVQVSEIPIKTHFKSKVYSIHSQVYLPHTGL